MAKMRVKTTGGRRAAKYVQTRRELLAMLENLKIEVGFPDGYIMPLAIAHEYGARDKSGKSVLPQRPAYRSARPEMRRAWRRQCKAIMRAVSKPRASRSTVLAMVRSAVREQRDILVKSYETFHGVPLSERQEARKRNTPGEGKQLVGHEGPKLVEHIEARESDGRKIDD